MRLRSGDKHHPRKSADRKAQIRKAFVSVLRTDLCFAICRFSRMVFIPRAQPHAQSLFLFPIVFGINLSLSLSLSLKLIANFSATMVTSLPSLSLYLSLTLSLSLSLRAHLTHNIGSASALPIRSALSVSKSRHSPFLRLLKLKKENYLKKSFDCKAQISTLERLFRSPECLVIYDLQTFSLQLVFFISSNLMHAPFLLPFPILLGNNDLIA